MVDISLLPENNIVIKSFTRKHLGNNVFKSNAKNGVQSGRYNKVDFVSYKLRLNELVSVDLTCKYLFYNNN